jgi:hypothetical protein
VGTVKSKSNSLKWAIEELSKQKEELNEKLNIAEKREETGLINTRSSCTKKGFRKKNIIIGGRIKSLL